MPMTKAELEELKKRALEAKKSQEAPPATEDPNAKRWGLTDPWPERRAQLMRGSEGLNPSEARELERREKAYGKGHMIARMLRATMCAELNRWSADDAPLRVLADVYKDPLAAKVWGGEMERALSAEKPSEGGYLFGPTMSDDFIGLIRPASMLLRLGVTEVPMPDGNLTVPRQEDGTSVTWAGENEDVNSSDDPSFGDVKLSAKKAVAIVAISNDLLRVQSVQADQIVERDARRAMAQEIDTQGLIGPGSQNKPLGLLRDPGMTDLAINAAVDGDTFTKFLKALLDNDVDLNFGLTGQREDDEGLANLSRIAWLFNSSIWEDAYNLKVGDVYVFREEMDRGRLLGWPFGVTSKLANGADQHGKTTIAFADWSEGWMGRQGSLEFDASREAAYKNSAGTVVAAYSRDQTVLRLIAKIDTRVRQLKKFVKSDNVYTA